MKITVDCSRKNAEAVLEVVENMIADYNGSPYLIRVVFDKLSIFDWWNQYLSKSQLKDMRKFLKTAIRLGYTGYVCFKVGATGCANGMWAHKRESTTGSSPDGAFIYKSFTPAYNYWTAHGEDGKCLQPYNEIGNITTIKGLEQLLSEHK